MHMARIARYPKSLLTSELSFIERASAENQLSLEKAALGEVSKYIAPIKNREVYNERRSPNSL